jgi:hypothetical protein
MVFFLFGWMNGTQSTSPKQGRSLSDPYLCSDNDPNTPVILPLKKVNARASPRRSECGIWRHSEPATRPHRASRRFYAIPWRPIVVQKDTPK